VRSLRNLKLLAAFIALTTILAFAQNIFGQSLSDMQNCFSHDYAGISINIDATKETVPTGNITIALWLNCTADSVTIDYLNLSIYGFRDGKEKILLNTTYMLVNSPIIFNFTFTLGYNVTVPEDVWGATEGEMLLDYRISELPADYIPNFQMTTVRNVKMEQLEQQLNSLNETYTQLNETYWELQGNYTSMQGTAVELDNTRRVVTILLIVAVFFLATTFYLVLKKPKDYW